MIDILVTISQIANLLLLFAWMLLLWVYTKRDHLEFLLGFLTIALIGIGLVSCLSAGLGLFGLE